MNSRYKDLETMKNRKNIIPGKKQTIQEKAK